MTEAEEKKQERMEKLLMTLTMVVSLHLRSVFLWYFRIFVRFAEEMDFFLYSSDYH